MSSKTPKEKTRSKDALVDAMARRAKRGHGKRAPVVERFVRDFFANVSPKDCSEADPEALAGAVQSAWAHVQTRKAGAAKVRVFNLDPEKDDWNVGHTIVEIVNDDMPFLVDSVTAELNRRNLTVHLVIHPIMAVVRTRAGKLSDVLDAAEPPDGQRESIMHIQVTEQADPAALKELRGGILRVLGDVRTAVEDWRPMRVCLADAIAGLDTTAGLVQREEISETADFLRWLEANNFTFLGYREYAIGTSGKKQKLKVVRKSGLGLLRDKTVVAIEGMEDGAVLPPDLAEILQRPSLTLINKGSRRSTVHRGVHLDAIMIKQFDESGRTVGQRLFVGLFTSTVYNQPVETIPVIRKKARRVIERSGFSSVSHDGKALTHILETLPRDELFQIGERELSDMAMGILHLQERQKVALFTRHDPFGRYVSCLVYVPRDRYDTRLRRRIHDVLETGFAGTVTAFYTQLSDEVPARLHFIVKTGDRERKAKPLSEIEAEVIETARDWADDLAQALSDDHGESEGLSLFDRYRYAFPSFYCEWFDPKQAVADIDKIESVIETGEIAMDLYRKQDADRTSVRFKVFNRDEPLPLSDVLPMLENMGLRVIDEIGHEVTPGGAPTVWIHDFGMVARVGVTIDIAAIRDAFEQTFQLVWDGEVEDDGFNAMVVSAGMTWREIVVLRAFSKYLRQAAIPFSETYMMETLAKNADIARDIISLFEERFEPRTGDEKRKDARLHKRVVAALDAVQNLDEDRILRRFLNLVDAMLRTNFYQPDVDGTHKSYVSFKFDSSAVDELPLPRPFREIFVYSARMEGVHLRGGAVARGGIRWSDRREDFRTEILGLMKAQMPKNAVIVPVGAKGGFVLKRPPTEGGREAFQQEGIACYKLLISGMLDITDNLSGGKVVPPAHVVRLDGDDPYLVVAADKGTATFSDIANGVAHDYGFWLDDAFASGGSVGYDHKKMGITARGGWESVKRHFREIGVNTQTEDFTVVGVGDMAGDVFGNGMRLSKNIKLVGAFNHMHIFVDPDPDPAASFNERERLFKLPRSAWTDYDAKLISSGGGIYERSAKSIKLGARARELFGISKETVTPNELIRAMLLADVDLLWFGGIGTYIKSSDESNGEVGDRVNDPLRINGREVRAKVLGEGANLGVTQLGRIEYALAGGRINTDFIDNSAGVGSSDFEVNIKILLNEVVADGKLDMAARNKLLSSMTKDVAAHVLMDNYRQSMALSHAEALAPSMLGEAGRFIRALERAGELDRAVEFLPDDEGLEERRARKQGLTRPELAVLLAYSKMTLYSDLLESDVPDDPWLVRDIGLYFPKALTKKYGDYLGRHRLRREISATYITNSLLNRCGPTFVTDLENETGAGPDRIVRAYLICRRVFGLAEYWAEIEALDNVIPAKTQTALNLEILGMIRRATIWFVERGDRRLDVAEMVRTFEPGIAELTRTLDRHLSPELAETVEREAARFLDVGVPEKLARGVANLDVLFAGCDIVRIAKRCGERVGDTARIYFTIGTQFGFDWLRNAAAQISADTDWQAMAVSAMIDDLYDQQARLTGLIADTSGGASAAGGVLEAWQSSRHHDISRLETTMADLRRAEHVDLAMLAVATRYTRALIDG